MTREERLRRIRENMDLFGPLPADYEEFTERAVFKLDNIIVYDTKANKGYCTGCKMHTDNLKLFSYKPKHNKRTECPCCGRNSIAKSAGLIKNGFEVVRWIMLVEKSDEDVLIRYINHTRKYKPDGNYEQNATELMRTVITRNQSNSFGMYYDGWAFYRKPYNSWNGRSEHYEPRNDVMLYNMNLDEDLKGTICEYSAVGLYIQNCLSLKEQDCLFIDKHLRMLEAYSIENYLWNYLQKPYLEQLVKLKFNNLLNVAMNYEYSYNAKDIFHPGKKRIHETLGLTRSDYLQLVKVTVSPTAKEVLNMIKLRKANVNVSNDTLYRLNMSSLYDVEQFISVRKYVSENKAVMMLSKNGTQYSDYLDMADRLGWDMKSSMVLFPKDVKKAHAVAVEQFNKVKQKNIRALLKKVIMSHVYEFEDDKMMIVVPKSGAQIVKEGHTLHHCVARYVDDVGKGKTMILFVRYKSNPGKPFYTLEWRDNTVKQCYGLKDCKTTPDVEKFIRDFENKLNHEMNIAV